MTTITFYGGVNEIGGNKILLEDNGTSIFIDFGMSFSQRAKFYCEYLNPRSFNGIGDLLTTGLIPPIPGIYRQDLCEGQTLDMEYKNEFYIQGLPPQAVILSHAHADHANYISLLCPDIPIYTGSISKYILQAIHDTGQRDLEGEIINFREKRPGVSWQHRPIIPRNFVTFESGKEFKIGSLKIIPFNVDHSIPDAYGFIIYTSDGVVVYTGDLRLHGVRPHLTSEFIKQAVSVNPIALICEGTNIEEEPGLSEEDVKEQTFNLIAKTDRLVFVTFGGRDLDRMYTFYQVAKESNRKLVITTKQAYLLELLSQHNNSHNFPIVPLNEVLIYISRKKDGIYQEKDYDKWERKYLSYPNVINANYVNKHQGEIIMSLDFFQINELIDIQPAEGAYYIRSMSEPFNEEMEIDAQILDNWLEKFRMAKSPTNDKHYYYQIHASGHASGKELKELVQQINPVQLFPIHTKRPELFQKIGVRTVEVEYGKEISLSV